MKFKDIERGDKVVEETNHGYGNTSYFVRDVGRVTKTLVIVNGNKYSKQDGMQKPRAERWTPNDYIHHITDEMLKRVEQTQLRKKAVEIQNQDWKDIAKDNPELIQDVYDLLQDVLVDEE